MALQNLLGGLATDAKLETLRLLLASGATDAKLETVRALLGPKTYTASSFNLTANQANGTDPIVAANANRKSLLFRAAADFEVALAPGQTAGMRVFASARDGFQPCECPMGALYLVAGSGLLAGNNLTVWEA